MSSWCIVAVVVEMSEKHQFVDAVVVIFRDSIVAVEEIEEGDEKEKEKEEIEEGGGRRRSSKDGRKEDEGRS